MVGMLVGPKQPNLALHDKGLFRSRLAGEDGEQVVIKDSGDFLLFPGRVHGGDEGGAVLRANMGHAFIIEDVY